MRSLFLVVAILLIVPGVCLAARYTETAKAGDYSVRVTFDKDRPVFGRNRVEIVVTDKSSEAVAGAQVKVDYLMPSLPGRSPMMAYSTTAKPVAGGYEATLSLGMKGLWNVVVSITAKQKTEKAVLTFEVR